MSQRPAFCHTGEYPAAPEQVFRMPRHYLLYATSGTMRLVAGGRAWTLPPARAALIAADEPIRVTLARPLTACSALFDPAHYPAPPDPLSVFEMSPLARELVCACAGWGDDAAPLPNHAATLFAALQSETWRLAATPTAMQMPVARTDAVARALELSEADMAGTPRFDAIAAAVGLTPRTLARRFDAELGMTWRMALRRLRIIRAAEMLAVAGPGVTEVAFAVGYNALSAFNAAFKDVTGLTPTAFRASCAGATQPVLTVGAPVDMSVPR
ncbi:helix-turn-helix transcriptional regulator [Maritimibacter sp. UBA3975]|uniref:helix-turn-helix domain-containing protein n=1 Tax=Maritimibacter sp. UBA3975 TaxID=1946833 RepID=UPI000C0BAE4B|nr:helix-turn-helix transcriptional regulator [Maritimibacter sp. UBA3975]MAM62624.1 AraC family transcriptional regulator [Maritimibacter sp.]|tara:strand:+ start:6491 stop:7300 length:810 start_codon:yes stop_codon:yes gene_type:complete